MTAVPLRSIPSPARPRVSAQKKRGLGSWLFFVVIVVAAFYGLIFSRISLDRSAFELDELQEQIAIEDSRHFQLRAEAAELMSPERIAQAATELGMVYPGQVEQVSAEVVVEPSLNPEMRWAQLRTLLSAQP